jgi:hypothetical protein
LIDTNTLLAFKGGSDMLFTASSKMKSLTGRFYIMVCDPGPAGDSVEDKYYIVGEFNVEQPGQFEEMLYTALQEYHDDIFGCVDNEEDFNPSHHIYVVPQAYWASLEDLKFDPVSALCFEDDEFEAIEEDEEEKEKVLNDN